MCNGDIDEFVHFAIDGFNGGHGFWWTNFKRGIGVQAGRGSKVSQGDEDIPFGIRDVKLGLGQRLLGNQKVGLRRKADLFLILHHRQDCLGKFQIRGGCVTLDQRSIVGEVALLNGIDRGLHFTAEFKIRCLKERDCIAHIGGASAKVQEDVFQVKGWIKACPLEVDRPPLYRSITGIVTARGLEGNFWKVGGLGLSNRRGRGKGIEPS